GRPDSAGQHARGSAAIPGVRRQDRQRDRNRPPRGDQGYVPDLAIPPELVVRGPRPVAGGAGGTPSYEPGTAGGPSPGWPGAGTPPGGAPPRPRTFTGCGRTGTPSASARA